MIDQQGNPTRNSFGMFAPYFELARSHGLKVSIHCAEVWEHEVNSNVVLSKEVTNEDKNLFEACSRDLCLEA